MTHHHHRLVLGNLRKLFGGHAFGPFRPLGRQSSRVQKLSHGGCLDTEVHVLWKWPDCLCYLAVCWVGQSLLRRCFRSRLVACCSITWRMGMMCFVFQSRPLFIRLLTIIGLSPGFKVNSSDWLEGKISSGFHYDWVPLFRSITELPNPYPLLRT